MLTGLSMIIFVSTNSDMLLLDLKRDDIALPKIVKISFIT